MVARVNGGNFVAGGLAAVAAEKAAEHLVQQYNDGKTAIDPQTGEFNANLLPEHIKEEIKERGDCITDRSGRGRHADRYANLRGGWIEWSRE